MKLPYGYVLVGEEIIVHEEKADVVRNIFEYDLSGASLGNIDMLFAKGIPSPTGKPKWTRATVDNLLANKKFVPIVGVKVYLDAQFEKSRRCNVDYDKAGHLRTTVRYKNICRSGRSSYHNEHLTFHFFYQWFNTADCFQHAKRTLFINFVFDRR